MKARIVSALAGSALALSAWVGLAAATEEVVVARLIIQPAESDMGYAMGPARSAAISDFARQALGGALGEDEMLPETAAVEPQPPMVMPESSPSVSHEITGASSHPLMPGLPEEEVASAATILPDVAPAFEATKSVAPVKRASQGAERKVVKASAAPAKRRTVSLPVPVAIGVFR